MLILPTQSDNPRYTQTVTLSDVAYRLHLEWNERAEAWFLGIATSDGTPLLSGRRVVVGWPLNFGASDPRLPRGVIEAIDLQGMDLDPAYGDLGTRVVLAFTPASELA